MRKSFDLVDSVTSSVCTLQHSVIEKDIIQLLRFYEVIINVAYYSVCIAILQVLQPQQYRLFPHRILVMWFTPERIFALASFSTATTIITILIVDVHHCGVLYR